MTLDNQRTEKTNDYSPAPRDFWGRFFFRFGVTVTQTFIRLTYTGTENLPKAPYVLAANHQTYVDGMWIYNGLSKEDFPLTCAMVGADLSTDHGLLGKIIVKVARGIPVDRHGNPIRGLIAAKNACAAGNIVLIHPEGTRTHDGRVAELQSGAAYISFKTKAPMVPVYISGGYETFPRHNKWPQRRNPKTGKVNHVNIHFGKPLYPSDFSDSHDMNQSLVEWMAAEEQNYLASES